MSWQPISACLPNGRLHLQQGPIDLIIAAEGEGRARALHRAEVAFETVLSDLVDELDDLRQPADRGRAFRGAVAQRMHRAALRHLPAFVTPMAAVAGAVADHVLAAMWGEGLRKAWVNNGGDIAFGLAPGAAFRAAVPQSFGEVDIGADQPWRGIATSGWGGRSHSLGIADAVTVLARSAAQADVAATLIANATDLPGHPAIARARACDLSPDSDLGTRLVTTGVGTLSSADSDRALARGAAAAQAMTARGLIGAAALTLKGKTRTHGALPLLQEA